LVQNGTMGVKCLAQEHNTMTPASTQTQIARYKLQLNNH